MRKEESLLCNTNIGSAAKNDKTGYQGNNGFAVNVIKGRSKTEQQNFNYEDDNYKKSCRNGSSDMCYKFHMNLCMMVFWGQLFIYSDHDRNILYKC